MTLVRLAWCALATGLVGCAEPLAGWPLPDGGEGSAPGADAGCDGGACRCSSSTRYCRDECIDTSACCDSVDCSPGVCDAGGCACPAGTRACGSACLALGSCCTSADCDAGTGYECSAGACACPAATRECAAAGGCIAVDDCCVSSDCVTQPGECYQTAGICVQVDAGARRCSYPPKSSAAGCTPDSNSCTDDRCDGAGICTHPFNTASCDDGIACTANDVCRLGTCQGVANCGAPPGECSQVGSCLADGGCTFVPKPSTAACTDDGNPCTDDLCNGSGGCAHPAKAGNTTCDDGKACTVSDVCSGSACAGTVSCTSPPTECYQATGVCGAGGGCEYTPELSSAACTSDGNVCTDDLCDGAGTCVHTSNTASCDDGKACTVGDVCSGSACAGTVSCTSPPTECYQATGACAGGGGCEYTPKLSSAACASDGNVCTDDHCDGAGTCVHTSNTATCDDGQACTISDVCSGTVCAGTVSCTSPPTECYQATGACAGGGACSYSPKLSTAACATDSNVCTDDHCDGAGTCAHTFNTVACDDMNSCTTGDTCGGGVCSGTPVSCLGGKVCVGGVCQCPAGMLWCAGASMCKATLTACVDLSCALCGDNAACNGVTVYDPDTQYDTLCASTLDSCDKTNAQSSNNADQQRYYQGTNRTCIRLNGVYDWYVRVRSTNAGGPGCRSRYALCTYICTDLLGYAAFCDGNGDWDQNIANAPAACMLNPTLPMGYACP